MPFSNQVARSAPLDYRMATLAPGMSGGYYQPMATVIDLKSRQRRRLEQDALVYHHQRQAEPFQPPEKYIDALRFRLRRRLGIDVATLHTRGEWESAVDSLFQLEMTDLLGQHGTPSELRGMFPEFVDEVWRD